MKHHATIEPLEPRIAPAAVFSYIEPDGDRVTVKSSLGSSVALFLAATFDTPGAPTKTLRKLNLGFAPAQFEGADISIAVTARGALGDGLVTVGEIAATGMDLGKVVVKGDLGQIDAGNVARIGPGVKSLAVNSIGVYGLATQGGMGDLTSSIAGTLGGLTVKANVNGAQILVSGLGSSLGSAKIGGSLNSSVIVIEGAIPSISIGRDVRGNSSVIESLTGNIGDVKIGGDLVGSAGAPSGAVIADGGNIKSVTVGGSILGGATASGFGMNGGVAAFGRIGSVSVGGDIVVNPSFNPGNAGKSVTGIRAGLDIGSVKVGDEVLGTGNESVEIVAYKNADPARPMAIKSVAIGGSINSLTIGAGYQLGSNPGAITGFADAQIGKVSVGGDWSNGKLLAGIYAPFVAVGIGNETLLAGGQPDVIARISSIVIKGTIFGSNGSGIIAEDVASMVVSGSKVPLEPLGAEKDRFSIGNLGGIPIYEV